MDIPLLHHLAHVYGFSLQHHGGHGWLCADRGKRSLMSLGFDPSRACVRLLAIAAALGRGAVA